MIRCKILNFKNFDFISMVEQCIVFAASLLGRYVSWTSSRTARDFSPRTVKISRSPCGKFNDIDAKHKQKSAIRAGTG
jgi:hypothetical protein